MDTDVSRRRLESTSCTEHVVRTIPFTVRRRVKWGECDPAGVVYTVVFAEYLISAADLFYSWMFDSPALLAKEEAGFSTPSRALSLEFESPLRPDDEFDMIVKVADIRKHTFVFNVEGRTSLGGVVFRATLTPICVSKHDRQAIELPSKLRLALSEYRANCARADE